jgi:hypothetical protein
MYFEIGAMYFEIGAMYFEISTQKSFHHMCLMCLFVANSSLCLFEVNSFLCLFVADFGGGF